MAVPIASLHIRSISLPSTSHPLDASIEDQLRRLRASQAGPSTSSSICQNLFSVKNLLESMNDFISRPHNQKGLSMGMVEEILEGSLTLLDASNSALDAVSQMKESLLDLQSSLRRGNANEGIHAYLITRKKIKKMFFKCLAYLKKAEKKHTVLEDDAIAVRMLKEAEAISISMLKSVPSFVMGNQRKSQSRNWSFVTKIIKFKHASSEVYETSEVEEVDCTLHSYSEKQMGVENKPLLNQLDKLEMVIQELEDGLESVSRCLIKTRVSLLNVLNH